MRHLLPDIYCLIKNYIAYIVRHYLLDSYGTELFQSVLPSDFITHVARHYFKELNLILFVTSLVLLKKQ